MARHVEIQVESRQTWDGRTETLEQRAEGVLARTGEGYTLTYREGEDTGLGGTRTTLKLLGDRAELSRTGAVSSTMVFCPGSPHRSLYETAYGPIPMEVTTRRLWSQMEETGGRVELEYDLVLGSGAAGQTLLRLTVKEKKRLS